jgi:hypothetical protein
VCLSVLREWRIPGDFFWSGCHFYIDTFLLDFWNIHLKRLTNVHHIIMAVMSWRHLWLVQAVQTGFVSGKILKCVKLLCRHFEGSLVFERFQILNDDPEKYRYKSGTLNTEENCVIVKSLIREDQRVKVHEIIADLNICKVAAHWVLKMLTKEHQSNRMAAWLENVGLCQDVGESYLGKHR